MHRVGFEATIPASERAKTIHVLDRAATVTGIVRMYSTKFPYTAFTDRSLPSLMSR
jgi:hypothetical protein